jgi:CubicO group peptidase (beta-lactamase class C family)
VHHVPDVIARGNALLEERLVHHQDVPDIGWVFVDAQGVYPGPGGSRRFRIASMTKSFTAATVVAVALDENLNRDAPLRDILPELSPTLHEATIHDALAMATGLPTDDAWADRLESMSREDFSELIAQDLILNQAPGVTYEYANLGYAMLGLVIERVTGRTFAELLDDYVLNPLQLTDTSLMRNSASVQGLHPKLDGTLRPVEPTGPGAFSPMGGLWSTPGDIGRWMRTLRNARYDYMRRTARTPGEHALKLIQDPRTFYEVRTRDQAARFQAYAYGLHYRWDTELGEFLFHSGGYPGFGSHMRWHTPTGLGLAVFGNRTYFPAEDVAEPVLDDMVREIGYQPRDPREKAAIYTVFEGPTATVENNLTGLLTLTERWDEQLARKIFSANVFQDYTQADLQQHVASLKQYRLTVDAWLSRTEVILGSPGQQDRLQVLFNPLGQIQKFTWG